MNTFNHDTSMLIIPAGKGSIQISEVLLQEFCIPVEAYPSITLTELLNIAFDKGYEAHVHHVGHLPLSQTGKGNVRLLLRNSLKAK